LDLINYKLKNYLFYLINEKLEVLIIIILFLILLENYLQLDKKLLNKIFKN